MGASAFASLICSKIQAAVGSDGGAFNVGTPPLCQAAIAEGITEYLIANTVVNISYTGMTTTAPSSPDPVVADVLQITGACAPMGTPTGYDEWLMDLQQKIADGFTVLSPGEALVTTVFQPFNPAVGALQIPQDGLLSAYGDSRDDPMLKVWEVVCQGIMDWINSSDGCNPAAVEVAATRPASAGTASLVNIVIT